MAPQKDCFGILNNVFPMGKEGLREIVPSCFECPDRKECLQAALRSEQGLVLKGEIINRAPAKGLFGRLKRWSDRKDLDRRLKQQQKQSAGPGKTSGNQ